jgi:hypothetical protein
LLAAYLVSVRQKPTNAMSRKVTLAIVNRGSRGNPLLKAIPADGKKKFYEMTRHGGY